MKKTISLILLLTIVPAAALAQWSVNLNLGWLGNASPDWAENGFDDKPFSLWESGWQAGGGLEYRAKDWLAFGGSGSYQTFSKQPAGSAEITGVGGQTLVWTGQASWQVPVSLYLKLIRPRAIMGTNLKLGLGVMASHVGQLTVITEGGFAGTTDTIMVSGTGETVYRPFGQISAGIKFPLTRRVGITLDYGFLMTFDQMVIETPLELGLAVGW
ncbi:MAG: outer membrane beta-barrel protein [Candidatus Edwardsbacteria bacterium]|nr:outer membrane beta-barrel protein [Candidatus Edwardsbacteria bacterium]MBU1575831.1 outer membrane beta-barrel protein [Candidatus Edwardsbacteria bacterium]MBU2463617.1 outer membrane beta-barrel protein [Candidatus Edwardsbacteria bacterium]MBU2593045.1 outer membrane beta-barrel protein [Candidatus Edwardsbacteria bacterium]